MSVTSQPELSRMGNIYTHIARRGINLLSPHLRQP